MGTESGVLRVREPLTRSGVRAYCRHHHVVPEGARQRERCSVMSKRDLCSVQQTCRARRASQQHEQQRATFLKVTSDEYGGHYRQISAVTGSELHTSIMRRTSLVLRM